MRKFLGVCKIWSGLNMQIATQRPWTKQGSIKRIRSLKHFASVGPGGYQQWRDEVHTEPDAFGAVCLCRAVLKTMPIPIEQLI